MTALTVVFANDGFREVSSDVCVDSGFATAGALFGCTFGAFKGGAEPLRFSLPALATELILPAFSFRLGPSSSALRLMPLIEPEV